MIVQVLVVMAVRPWSLRFLDLSIQESPLPTMCGSTRMVPLLVLMESGCRVHNPLRWMYSPAWSLAVTEGNIVAACE